jgi:hypothetical protein
MSRTQPSHIRRFLASLHFKDRAQINILAERLQILVDIPRPHNSTHQQWDQQRGQHPRLSQGEDASHEEQEDDDTPD